MLFENAFKVYDTESLVVVIKQSGKLVSTVAVTSIRISTHKTSSKILHYKKRID